MSFFHICKQSFSSRSIQRILLQLVCESVGRKYTFGGKILDIGAGNNFEYYQYLNIPRAQVTRSDYDAQKNIDVTFDANVRFPFDNESFDGVMAMNMMYILQSPEHFLGEIKRILKPGGMAVLYAPLLFHEAPEPVDYWRFTSQGISLLIQKSGLYQQELLPVGERFTTRQYLFEGIFRWKKIFFACRWFALLGDMLIKKYTKNLHPAPIGYICVLKK